MKELLLSKSNIRKSKGLTIGLILLIMIATCFLNIVLMLFTDFNKNANNTAKKLNSDDAYIELTGDISKIDDEYIKSIITDDILDYEISRQLGDNYSINTPYGDGTVTPIVTFKNTTLSNIGKTEIILEDESIKTNYIYLPYQYHTGGKFNTGDDYQLKMYDNEYTFKIKGFFNNMSFSSYNLGIIEIITSDDIYNELKTKNIDNIIIKFKLKENVNQTKFINTFATKISSDHDQVTTFVSTLENAIFARTYMAFIFGALFMAICLVIIVIVLLMLSNNISNYIKENIRTLGAIKALGYTNKEIKISFIMQFLIISIIGCILGICLSYLLFPSVVNIISIQSGLPYNVSFNTIITLTTVLSTLLIVILSVLFCVRKTNKITPINALRDGISTHNFKKNRILLSKTKLPINISMALKTMFFNIKQNIATSIIMFFLVFVGAIGVVLFQNLSIDPKLSIFSFEICDGAINVNDSKYNNEVYDYIKSQNVSNLRNVTNALIEIDDARVMTYILDDADKLNNQDVCYEGRLPKYDNEIALSGKLAKNYGYKIGDEITASLGNKKEKYILTGFIQSTNNNGSEGVLLETGAQKILGEEFAKMYYFETDDISNVLSNIENKFGDKIVSFDFKEIISGSITVFKTVAAALLIIVVIISASVILLVLYLLIKTLINNKKKDYGILKALGYSSWDIMNQNALSFMPTIMLSVITSCIVSYFTVNPALCLILNSFGIMKLNFDIPINLIIIMGIGFIIISFIIALWLSKKIKKIEPYKLLIGE